METHHTVLDTLTPHGQAYTKMEGGELAVRTTHSVTSIGIVDFRGALKRHYVSLPGRYRLPLRVDLMVKLDHPAFYLFIGGGHITFASAGQDNRKLEDAVRPTGKANQDHGSFDNRLPLGAYVDIAVIYNRDEMQILVGGEERFYSCKQAYMRAKNLGAVNEEGLPIGLAVSKGSTLTIRGITVTQGPVSIRRGNTQEAAPPAAPEKAEKPSLETVIAGLPREYRERVLEMDTFLRSLRPLKCRRVLDKNGYKITYVAADYGVSYAVEVWEERLTHSFNWYIVYNGKPETWHRKADWMEESLAETARSNPALAGRIFYALNDCVGCHGPGCLAKTLYTYDGQKRMTCHGRVMLRMCEEDFRDTREFFQNLNGLIEKKIADGEPLPEKILLLRS